jgi:hypothetical protein
MLMAIFAKKLVRFRNTWIRLEISALGRAVPGRRSYRLSDGFPHSFTFERFVEEVRGFVERKDLPPDLSRKILWDNPKRLYGI